MKLFSVIAAGAVISSSIFTANSVEASEVDPKMLKLCIEAKDYAGCVRAMKGEAMPTSRVINSLGADIAEGNSCPAGYAYRGGGNCQEVKCTMDDGNDPMLGGKNHKCGNAPFFSGYIGRMTLRWGEATSRSFTDVNCPSGVPKVGWTSTCNYASADWESPAAKTARDTR